MPNSELCSAKVAPSSHTVAEIVNARWGKTAHLTFLFFCFSANIIVTSMLLLGGAATVEALTGMDYRVASFLIPWGIILYTATGGLQAIFLASYIHTSIIFAVVITMVFLVYIKVYSSDLMYTFLTNTVNHSKEYCEAYFFDETKNATFFKPGMYACGEVAGNEKGSYLTMISGDGLMFGLINIVGNFGTVFVDQSYWQSAIAARPESAAKGYFLGGYVSCSSASHLGFSCISSQIYFDLFFNRLCWFSIPFSLATSLGLASTALMLPINAVEAGAGLVPPAVAVELMGTAGAVLILIMLFMAIVSTGSAESIAVSSLVAYDIYRQYINPQATGDQILFVARVVIVLFGLFMGAFAILLSEIGLDLGWVYLFMGIVIGSAVFPLWNMMTWKKASGTGAVVAAWGGFGLALLGWIVGAKIQSNQISVAALGTNEVMLAGNLIAILSSGLIHFVWSMWIDPQDFDFSELDSRITLVGDDRRGLTDDERNPHELEKAERWIRRRGYGLTLVLIVIWPLMSIPAGIFSRSYFAFWVLLAIGWALAGGIVLFVLPLAESSDDINMVLSGFINWMLGREAQRPTAAMVGDTKADLTEEVSAAHGN